MAQPESFKPISEDNIRILAKAKDDLLISLDKSWLVSPTEQLTKSPGIICTSDLTIGFGENSSFTQKNLKDALNQNQPSFESLKQTLNTVFSESMRGITTLIYPHFLRCQAEILTKLCKCGNKIHIYHELHYVLHDPIMEMLCTIFSLQVCLLFCGMND